MPLEPTGNWLERRNRVVQMGHGSRAWATPPKASAFCFFRNERVFRLSFSSLNHKGKDWRMLADIIANHDDIAGVILDHLDLETLVKVSKVSKMISAYDFASLLESKTVRFVHGKTYVSTPTGWHNRIYSCTITRKHVKSKTVLWQNGRRKVRMRKELSTF